MLRFVCWVWSGMILGVSFLAAPVKFQAESLTLPVALDVGRVTFQAFDRLEWLWAAALVVVAIRDGRHGRLDRGGVAWIGVILVIVVVQSAVFLPALDARVALVLAGEILPPSPLHTISGVAEVLQVLALLWLGARTPGRDRPG